MLLRAPGVGLVAMQRAQHRRRLLYAVKQRVLPAGGGAVGRQREMVRGVAAAMALLLLPLLLLVLLVLVRMRAVPQVSQAAVVAGAHAAPAGAGGAAGHVAGARAVQQARVNFKRLPLRHAAQHVQQLCGGARSRRRLARRSQRRRRRPARRLLGCGGGGAAACAAGPPRLVLGGQLRRAVEHILAEAQVRLDLQGGREGRRAGGVGGVDGGPAGSGGGAARPAGGMSQLRSPAPACWRRPWPRRGPQRPAAGPRSLTAARGAFSRDVGAAQEPLTGTEALQVRRCCAGCEGCRSPIRTGRQLDRAEHHTSVGR